MSRNELNGRGGVPNVDYKHSCSYNKEDFELWVQRFKASKMWQEKHTRSNKKSREEFVWYDHNTFRSKGVCNHSMFEDMKCGGKIKVPTTAGNDGRYTIVANEDGYKHLLHELCNDFIDAMNSPANRDEDHEKTINELIASIDPLNSNQVAGPSNSDQVVGPSNSDQVRDTAEQVKHEWNQLADQLREFTTISTNKKLPKSQLQPIPPSIICVTGHNDRIDWKALGDNKDLKMVFARCTFGVTIDEQFRYNFPEMVATRFSQLGVYHYFLAGLNSPSPQEQFEVVTKVLYDVGFNKKRDLFAIAVQTEHNADCTTLIFTARLVKFISLLMEADFMRPIIYCNNNSWNVLIDKSCEEQFSKLPLWIAHFTENESPRYPDTWRLREIPWFMWHYEHKGSMNGIINHVNFNRRNELYTVRDSLFSSNV